MLTHAMTEVERTCPSIFKAQETPMTFVAIVFFAGYVTSFAGALASHIKPSW